MAEGAVTLLEMVAKDKASQTIKTIDKNIDRLTKTLQDEAMKVKLSAKQYDIYRVQQELAAKGQKHLIVEKSKLVAKYHDEINAARRAAKINKAHAEALVMNAKRTHDVAKASGRLNGQLRFMRGGFGQVGHQIQDVAVQLQMGQNAMLVFGQQGSQIASLFGPGGALIGAILAVGAAVGTALAPALFKSNKELVDLANNAEDLIDKYPKLSEKQKTYVETFAYAEVARFNKQLAESKSVIADLEEEASSPGLMGLYDLFFNPEKAIADMAKSREDLQGQYKLREQLQEKTDELAEALSGQTKETRDLVKALEEEAAAVGKTRRELDLLTVSAGPNAEATRARINAAHDAIEQTEKEAKAVKDATDAWDAYKKKQADAARSGVAATENFMESLRKQSATFGATRAEALAYSVDMAGLSPVHKKEADDLVAAIQRKIDAREKEKESEKAYKEEADRQKGVAGAFDSLVSSMGAELGSPEDALRAELQARQDIIDEYAALGVHKDGEIKAARLQSEEIFNQQMKELAMANAQAQLTAASSVISSFQGQMSAMSSMIDENSRLGKAFFVAQQAMAAAQAIIKGHEAGMNVFASMSALGPVGVAMAPGMAAAAVAMGYAQAGMITGQTLASFEGGGFTGAGSRSAGLDNKGGFHAVLHPNESVVDHTKGQGMAQPAQPQNIRIVNAFDTSVVGDYMGSDAGEKAIMNVVRRNRQTIQTMVV